MCSWDAEPAYVGREETRPALTPHVPDHTVDQALLLAAMNMHLAAENAMLRWQRDEAVRCSAAVAAAPGLYQSADDVSTQALAADSDDEPVVVEETPEFPWQMPPPAMPGTSLMLRNIPNNYSRSMLVDLFHARGFAGQFDLLYLPIDFKSTANLGYAFVNLVDHENVEFFWKAFEGFSAWASQGRAAARRGTKKVGKVEWNEVQGRDALVERFRDNPVMHPSVPEEYKPLLLTEGEDVAFPPPTRTLKAPRVRKPTRSKTAEGAATAPETEDS